MRGVLVLAALLWAAPAGAQPRPTEVVVPAGSTVTIKTPDGSEREVRPATTHFLIAQDAAVQLIADRDLARRLTADLKACEGERAKDARRLAEAGHDRWRPLRWLAVGVTVGAGIVAGVWVGTSL